MRSTEQCRLERLGTVITQDRLDEHALHCSGGLCCIVSPCFTILHVRNFASSHHGKLVECLIIEVQEVHSAPQTHSVRIGNIYCTPGGTLNMGALLDELTQPPYLVDIFAGDFNARHSSWSPGARTSAADAFARGSSMVRWCSRHRFSRSNQGIPVIATTSNGTSLDFVLLHPRYIPVSQVVYSSVLSTVDASQREKVDRSVVHDPPSDHFPVILNTPSSTAKWNRRVPRIRWSLTTPTMLDTYCSHLEHARTIRELQWTMHHHLHLLPRSGWRVQPPTPLQIPADITSEAQAWELLQSFSRLVPPVFALFDEETQLLRVSPLARASALNRLFAQKHAGAALPPFGDPSAYQFHDASPITNWEVKAAIRHLRAASSEDDLGLTPKLVQSCESVLLKQLPALYTTLIQSPSRMPPEWKTCTFIPLFKEGKNPRLLGSYRPVAITALLCRLLERILSLRLLSELDPPLSRFQFGYTPGRSTLDAIGHVIGTASYIIRPTFNTVSGSKRRSTQVLGKCLAGYLDLTDAFCRIPQPALLDGLMRRRVSPYLIAFVRIWLTGRTAATYVMGRKSPP